MITLDGSYGEGGGQILRTALPLATLTGEEVKIIKVRANRPNPGIQAQHLSVLRAYEVITGGRVSGATIGSREVIFSPGRVREGHFTINVGTAGSVTLVSQALLPLLVYTTSTVKVMGGTDVKWAPTYDYLERVFLRFLRVTGAKVRAKLLRRGFYPRGGGAMLLSTTSVPSLSPFTITSQERGYASIVSVAGGLPRSVAERQAKAASSLLEERGVEVGEVEVLHYGRSQVLSPGTSITVYHSSSFVGADNVGEKGVPAEVVGKVAAKHYIREASAPLDSHMGDQVIPYMALARGRSRVKVAEITLHTLTNVYVTEEILGVSFKVKGSLGEEGEIEVEGVGYEKGED